MAILRPPANLWPLLVETTAPCVLMWGTSPFRDLQEFVFRAGHGRGGESDGKSQGWFQ
jgi:hypothetical protein